MKPAETLEDMKQCEQGHICSFLKKKPLFSSY